MLKVLPLQQCSLLVTYFYIAVKHTSKVFINVSCFEKKRIMKSFLELEVKFFVVNVRTHNSDFIALKYCDWYNLCDIQYSFFFTLEVFT